MVRLRRHGFQFRSSRRRPPLISRARKPSTRDLFPVGTTGRHVGKYLDAPQPPPLVHLEGPNVPRTIRVLRVASLGHLQPRPDRRKALPVRFHQVVSGNRSFTGSRSGDSGEYWRGHPRLRLTGCRTRSEAELQISYRRRRREPCHLHLARPLPRLPEVKGRLHPQPGLRT